MAEVLEREDLLPEKELTDGEKKFVSELLGGHDDAYFLKWVTKTRRSKKQHRLIVIGPFRVYSIKRGGVSGKKEIRRQGHFFDLKEVSSSSPFSVKLVFTDFDLELHHTNIDEVIWHIRLGIQKNSYNIPEILQCKMNLTPETRTANRALPLIKITPAEGYLALYAAFCDYNNSKPSQAFVQFVLDNASAENREMKLHECAGIEQQKSDYALDIKPVFQALRFDHYFLSIVVEDILRKDVVVALADTLRHNVVLQSIILSNVDATEGFVALGESLKNNTKHAIATLDLSRNALKDRGAIGLAAAFHSLWNHSLKVLNLAYCRIEAKGLRELTNAFIGNKTAIGALVELNLSNNPIGPQGSQALAEWITSLSVDDLELRDEKFRPALRRLLLADCQLNLLEVVSSISNSLLHTLQEVDLSGNKLDKLACEVLASVLERSHTLEVVNLKNCQLSAASVHTLLSGVILNQTNKDASHAGASSSASATAAAAATTTTATIVTARPKFQINLATNALNAEAAISIARAIKTCSNLQTLNLASNSFGITGMTHLVEALNESIAVENIDLSDNLKESPKTHALLQKLHDLLATSRVLKNVRICGTDKLHLGKDMAIVLSGLKKSESILALDICGQRMGEPGAMALADAMRENKSVEFLAWDGNLTQLEGMQAFASCLKGNKTLKEMPTPVSDIRRCIIDSKDRTKMREKIQLVMNSVQEALMANGGDMGPTPINIQKTLKIRDPFRQLRAVSSFHGEYHVAEAAIHNNNNSNNGPFSDDESDLGRSGSASAESVRRDIDITNPAVFSSPLPLSASSSFNDVPSLIAALNESEGDNDAPPPPAPLPF